MNGKEYRPSLSHSILASAILVPISFILFSFLLWILFNTFWGESHLIEALWIALPISVVSGFLVGQMFNRTLRVSSDSVQFFLFGRMYRSIPFEGNTFSATTRSISYDGLLPISTSPSLTVIANDGGRKEYPCEGFSPEVFEAFISEIISVSTENLGRPSVVLPVHEATAMQGIVMDGRSGNFNNESTLSNRSFSFPKKEYLSSLIKRMEKTLLIVTVIGIFFIGLVAFLYWNTAQMPAFYAVGVFFFLLLCGTAAQHLYEYYMVRKYSPGKFNFSAESFMVDSIEFSPAEIDYIRATPPQTGGNITRKERQILIVIGKKTYKFTFGNIAYFKSCYYVRDYGDLWKRLESQLDSVGKKIINDI